MFFKNEKSLQNTDFAVIIVYLPMLLLVSILVSWISWMIRWLSRKDNGNLPRITNQEELKVGYKEEDIHFL